MESMQEDAAAQHLPLRDAVGPATEYLCSAIEIGVVKAFVDWKVFDSIPDGDSISTTQLAAAIGGEKELLDRLLPYLVATGFLTAPRLDHVAHTDRSRLYRSDTIAAGFLTHCHNLFIRSAAQLPAYLATYGFQSPKHADRTPFGMATGHLNESLYDILAAEPKLGKEFDSFVGSVSEVFPMHGVYDLSWMMTTTTTQADDATAKRGRTLFVDIGGSNGHALRDILADHPWMAAERCAVLDRAPTIALARADPDPSIGAVQLVEGDVFAAIPAPVRRARAYQFRRILNDVSDDDVRRAWRSVRAAAAPDTRVYIVEELLQPHRNAYAVAQDIALMLVGGKRRDAEMHGELAAEVGFRLSRKFPDTYNDCSVLEFVLE